MRRNFRLWGCSRSRSPARFRPVRRTGCRSPDRPRSGTGPAVLRRLDHVVGRPVVVVAVEDGQGGVLALDRGDRVEVLFDRGGERHVLGGHRKFVEVFRAFIGKVGTRSIVVPHGADLEEGFGNGYRDLHGLAALRAFGGVDLEVFVIDNGDGIGGRCFRAGGDDKGYILIGHGETIREHRIPPPSDTGSHGLSL